MAAADRKAKNQKMAADLIKRGFPHGRRQSSPRHNNNPTLDQMGSAAYRRMTEKRRSAQWGE